MSSNVIDYFAVLGKDKGPLLCKNVSVGGSDDHEVTKAAPTDLWNSAITDIAIIFPDKEDALLADGWEIIRDTIDGNSANLNSGDTLRGSAYIALKRRLHSRRLDHIVELKLMRRGDELSDGYEVLHASISGIFPADINSSGISSVLAVKRADSGLKEYFIGTSFVDDICMVHENRKEELPEEYVTIGNKKAGGSHGNGSESFVRIAYRKCSPLGICDLSYECVTLDRYPLADLPNNPLPTKELPLFAFPHEVKLVTAPASSYPLPDFFSMVFTGSKGDYLYCACLRFFEIVDDETLKLSCRSIYGQDIGTEVKDLSLQFNIYCPKVICVISRNPFYRAMRRYLRQLYSLSISSLQCPLEFFITSVVAQVPTPIEGGRSFNLHLDAALITSSSRAMAPIRFDVPPCRFFPHMDLDFSGPLRCLSVENLLAVFTLMLQEAKIVFLCHSNALLTEVMETLRSLLFPLTWSSCFVSRLPDALAGLLQALGGFMIGLHVPSDAGVKVAARATRDSLDREKSMQSFFKSTRIADSLQSGTYIIDLSDNEIYQYSGNMCNHLNSAKLASLTKHIPVAMKKRLSNRLQKIATNYKIGPQTTGLEIFDSAFEFHSLDESNVSASQWARFPTLDVRDAFMVFMIDLFGDYTKYIIPPNQDLTADVYRTLKEEYATVDYLIDCERIIKPTIEALLETQMFAVLLQQRSEQISFSLVFFECAADLLRELGLSTGGHAGAVGSWTQSKGLDLPISLYKLVGQHMFTSIFELSEESSQVQPKFKASHPLDRAIARLEALESMVTGNSSDEDEDDDHYLVPERFSVVEEEEEDKEEAKERDNSEMRNEIDRSDELYLHDVDFGPLLIPGPTLSRLQMLETASITESSLEKQWGISQYSYPKGWPALDEGNIALSFSAIHPHLEALRESRMFTLEKTDRQVRMLTRTPYERMSFRLSGRLLKEVNLSLNRETKAVLGLIADLGCLSMLNISVRVLHKKRPMLDVLQIFGIIGQYEGMGMLELIDESVWRGILLACCVCGGDFMRSASCVVWEVMKNIHIVPDAVTYGQYIRALAATKYTVNANEEGPLLDPFTHLEELGLIWLVRRAFDIQQALQKETKPPESKEDRRKSLVSKYTTESPPRRSLIDYFRGRTPPTATFVSSSTSRVWSSSISNQVNQKLGLGKVAGCYSMSGPSGPRLPIQPRTCPTGSVCPIEQNTLAILKKFDRINMELYNRYSDSHMDALGVSEFSPFRPQQPSDETLLTASNLNRLQESPPSKRAEAPLPISPIRGIYSATSAGISSSPPPKNQSRRWSIFTRRANASAEELSIIQRSTAELVITKVDTVEQEMKELKASQNTTEQSSDGSNEHDVDVIDSTRTVVATPPSSPPVPETPLSPGAKRGRDNLLKIQDLFQESLAADKTVVGMHSRTPCECGYAFLDEEVLSLWCGFDVGANVSNTNLSKISTNALDIISAHQLRCPLCKTQITPQLHVRCFSSSTKRPDGVLPLWEETVNYLSPFGLRFGIEDMLSQIGEQAVDSSMLHARRPDLYWNAMWYFTRLGLPSGFLPLINRSNGPYDGFIITGWREHLVTTKVSNYFNGCFDSNIQMVDLFPAITSTDIDKIEILVEKLQEKTHDGVKNLLFELSTMPRILNSCGGGKFMDRNVYISFLTILHFYRPGGSDFLVEPPSMHLAYGNTFDELYSEVIATKMTDEEFSRLGSSRTNFKCISSNKAAVAIRSSFGYLP